MTNAERYSLSAAVFTALTDVELEIDGLMPYDRALIKMAAQPLHQIHTQLIQASHALNQGPAGEQQACVFSKTYFEGTHTPKKKEEKKRSETSYTCHSPAGCDDHEICYVVLPQGSWFNCRLSLE